MVTFTKGMADAGRRSAIPSSPQGPTIRNWFYGCTRPDHPKLVLRVYKGKIIGMVFETDAAAGWQPWYDQSVGKPISHGGGPANYSQTIYLKPPPSAADCIQSSDRANCSVFDRSNESPLPAVSDRRQPLRFQVRYLGIVARVQGLWQRGDI
ncbi:MAG: hypothetical protein K2X00_23665 [Nitrospiraceae bacterium]|nr:hypothetical protein [Nitrospiraceae bacterium]